MSAPRRRPPAEPRQRRRSRGGGSDLAGRVLVAVPAIFYAIFIVYHGGLVFALGVLPLAIVALSELYTMMRRARPIDLAGFVAVAGMIFAALYGDQFNVLLALSATVPLAFLLALVRPTRENVSWGIAATVLGVAWVGLALSHAVLIRELEHGGALVLDILIGTFISDTAAYFGGRAYGRRPLAPRISPNKTVEGLIAGIAGGTFAFWLFATSYHDWFDGTDALIVGLAVAIAAPLGDLFESLVKRDLAVKDAGRLFGAHGGVLDRLDGVLFSVIAAYYVSAAVM